MTANLLNFLETIKDRYPFGIPKRVFAAQSESRLGSSKLELSLILILGSKLSDGGKELLEASILKGLQLPAKSYRILESRAITKADLLRIYDKEGVNIVVCFEDNHAFEEPEIFKGCSVQEGEWFNLFGKKALRIISPNKVSTDSSLKRTYWSQLQKVLSISGSQK